MTGREQATHPIVSRGVVAFPLVGARVKTPLSARKHSQHLDLIGKETNLTCLSFGVYAPSFSRNRPILVEIIQNWPIWLKTRAR